MIWLPMVTYITIIALFSFFFVFVKQTRTCQKMFIICNRFICRGKIISFEIALFCKISDGQVVCCHGNKNYKHFEVFFFRGICKSDMDYLGTICIVHIHICCKKIFRLENEQFLVF